MENWYLWQDDCHSPALNMAIDEVLMLEAASLLKQPLLRLYEWDRSAISFGYIQKYEKIPEKGFRVRRLTGGGIVFHDTQFTYTIVLPPDHPIVTDTKPIESYNITNQGVQSALARLQMASQMSSAEIPKSIDRASMVCFTTPTRYDLLSEQGKIAGAAQRRTKHGLLHQGSIELEAPLTAALIREHLPVGFANIIPCTYQDFPELMQQKILLEAKNLARDKYELDSWNALR